ncbi:MAG: 16S rRNA (cytidine(1402)-2'-O)-methyltransferase [candidate division Zixibacteria bacterium 4484_95]|nr:MAG: 16S rRNA (cytidine(1402)-2'-O)-methyltransferase [candidate division Zixibacteria bacterium 4484_95]
MHSKGPFPKSLMCEVLKSVDLIASEDTRHTGVLLKHYDIATPQLSYHDYNKERVTPRIVGQLLDGKDVAVVSDAGTPGISDPGFYLIRECIRNGIEVIPIPGPSSLMAAIVISGLPTDRFCFEGFLPRSPGKMKKRLIELKSDRRTLIFLESARRINKTLVMILEVLGDRDAFVGRELTKKFEQSYRSRVSELIEIFKDKPPKGELVLVVAGKREDIG